MFEYKERTYIDIVKNVRPDIELYLQLKEQFHGCEDGLQDAIEYLRESYMLHHPMYRNGFVRAAVRKLNDMEMMAQFLHNLHGMDHNYFDEQQDDITFYHEIAQQQSSVEPRLEKRIHNDYTAALLYHKKQEAKTRRHYEQMKLQSKDPAAQMCLQKLIDGVKEIEHMIDHMLTYIHDHETVQTFGEADSDKSWDLGTSNYFDPLLPEFFSRSNNK